MIGHNDFSPCTLFGIYMCHIDIAETNLKRAENAQKELKVQKVRVKQLKLGNWNRNYINS